jgi:hypothetical protein
MDNARKCVADIEGAWVNSNFESGLIESLQRNWSVPIAELSNGALAQFLRQRIALSVIAEEARRRIKAGFDDGSEMYGGQLAQALKDANDRV